MVQAFFIRPNKVHESRFVPSLLFPAVFALIQDGNQLFINSLGKPCGGGNNNKTVLFFVFVFFSLFFSFYLHTWLYLLMMPALIMLVIPGLPSYNRVEVYYLKGVIGLPIVISFRDRWYIYFFFLNWAHWWRHRQRLDRFRFQNFQSPALTYYIMGKVELVIYCCLTANIFAKDLHKFWVVLCVTHEFCPHCWIWFSCLGNRSKD